MIKYFQTNKQNPNTGCFRLRKKALKYNECDIFFQGMKPSETIHIENVVSFTGGAKMQRFWG